MKVGDLVKHKRFPLIGIIINIHSTFIKSRVDVLSFDGNIISNLELRNFKILSIS